MKKQIFDETDPANLGRPFYFDIDKYADAVEMMICSDEIQLALDMIKNVPGWFRQNPHPRLVEMANIIYRQCYDPFDYANDHDEAAYTQEAIESQCLSGYTYPRADVLKEEIQKLNAKDQVPWIFEISPSHGWLPLGFAKRGLKFNFYGKNLNQPALDKIKNWLSDGVWAPSPCAGQIKMLICYEALEHMWNPHDLQQSPKKMAIEFDQIYLSTPNGTLLGGLPDWRTRRIGHVRTWTPIEFCQFASKSFHGYTWELFNHHSMVLKGIKHD